MTVLRAVFRAHVAILLFLISLTLAFAAYADPSTSARIVWGLACVFISVFGLFEFRKENRLAAHHLLTRGVVVAVKQRRRGYDITYEFAALDGAIYTGEYATSRRMNQGKQIGVLYLPLNPSSNKPTSDFLFYSFQPWASAR